MADKELETWRYYHDSFPDEEIIAFGMGSITVDGISGTLIAEALRGGRRRVWHRFLFEVLEDYPREDDETFGAAVFEWSPCAHPLDEQAWLRDDRIVCVQQCEPNTAVPS